MKYKITKKLYFTKFSYFNKKFVLNGKWPDVQVLIVYDID